MATPSSSRQSPRIVLSSSGRAWRKLDADFLHVPRGSFHAPGAELHSLGVHFGPPVNADCRCGDRGRLRSSKPHGNDHAPSPRPHPGDIVRQANEFGPNLQKPARI